MKLDVAQSQKVAAWINEGCKLSEIQNRLAKEFGMHLTYLDVRVLVDELNLKPKDPEPVKPPPAPPAPVPAPKAAGATEAEELPLEPEAEPGTGSVTVTLDQITRPGAMVSGEVTFSDGKHAHWLLDQTGKIGLSGVEKGYKPTAGDIQLFQIELQEQLQKLGYA